MQRIKHHYCWVKAFAAPDDGQAMRGAVDVESVAASEPPQDKGEMQLAWDKSGALAQDYLPPPPSPDEVKVAWGPVDPHSNDGLPDRSGPDAPSPPLGTVGALKPFFGPVDPYMHFAGASLMGTWKFEAMSAFSAAEGMPAILLGWRPMFGDRADAVAWLTSPQGIDWSKGALSLGLTCFSVIGEL